MFQKGKPAVQAKHLADFYFTEVISEVSHAIGHSTLLFRPYCIMIDIF